MSTVFCLCCKCVTLNLQGYYHNHSLDVAHKQYTVCIIIIFMLNVNHSYYHYSGNQHTLLIIFAKVDATIAYISVAIFIIVLNDNSIAH